MKFENEVKLNKKAPMTEAASPENLPIGEAAEAVVIPVESEPVAKKKRVMTVEQKQAAKIRRQNKQMENAGAPTIIRKRVESKKTRLIKKDEFPIESPSKFIREQAHTEPEVFQSVVLGSPDERLAYSDNDAVFITQEIGTSSFKKIKDAIEERTQRKEWILESSENERDIFDDFENTERQIAHSTKNFIQKDITPGIANKERSYSKTNDFERTQSNLKTYSDSKTERNNRGFLAKMKQKFQDLFMDDTIDDFDLDELDEERWKRERKEFNQD